MFPLHLRHMLALTLFTATPLFATTPAMAQETNAALYPVRALLIDDDRYLTYPSSAAGYLVYSQRQGDEYSVARAPVANPEAIGSQITPTLRREVIRFGVALEDGSVGYASSRMGDPGSIWIKHPNSEMHDAIANSGAMERLLIPNNLKAAANGSLWAFDMSLEKTRSTRMRDDFADPTVKRELLGQTWRNYSYDAWRVKMGYAATRAGNSNKFEPPVLFVFDQKRNQLAMIANAFCGGISADGSKVAFVREDDGNFDIWMVNRDGSNLTQLTHNEFGDFEPAFSPDGKRMAFASNRDSKGEVMSTSIYVLELASGKIERVTNASDAVDGGPTWLDNNNIAFHSNRNPKKPQTDTVSDWNLWSVSLKE